MKFRGVVKGNTILLDEAVGFPEGQVVEFEILEPADVTKTVSGSNGLDSAWRYLHLPPDKFGPLSGLELSEVEIKVTVVNADD